MPLTRDSENTITEFFASHNLEINDNLIRKIGLYHDLILEWSSRINLVSKNDLGGLLQRHILDSLTPIKEIPRKGSLVDIGSGAGFPAIPIALVRPGLDMILLESIKKKAIFLNEAINALELTRVSIWNGRLEAFFPTTLCDIVTVRAVRITKKIEKHLRRIVVNTGKVIYYNKFNEYELL